MTFLSVANSSLENLWEVIALIRERVLSWHSYCTEEKFRPAKVQHLAKGTQNFLWSKGTFLVPTKSATLCSRKPVKKLDGNEKQ